MTRPISHGRWLAGLVSITALAWATQAAPQASALAQEARIDRLEAALAVIQAQIQPELALERQNAELTRQVSTLKSQLDEVKIAQIDEAKTIEGQTPRVKVSLDGAKPSLVSADGRFSLNLRTLVQLDAGLYDQAAAGPVASDFRRTGPALGFTAGNADAAHARRLKDGVEFRRARFGIDGSAFGPFEYRLIFDFGGSGVENAGQLYEGWAQYSGFKPFKLRIGAFAPQEGLADQDSAAAQPLLDRPASAEVARNLGAGDTRMAAQLFATHPRWLASVAVTGRTVGVLNTGTGTATPQTFGDPLAFVGRLAVTPLIGKDWRLQLGVHATYLARPSDLSGPPPAGVSPSNRYTTTFSDQGELRVDGTRLINTGNIDARHVDNFGLEFAAQWRGLLVQSEYDHFDVQRTVAGLSNPHFDGGYVEASWVLFGEARRYNPETAAFDAPPVRHPLGESGIGAVELAARYGEMNLNYDAGSPGISPAADAIRGGDLKIWTAGINWYLTPATRLALEFQHVRLFRLSPDATIYQTAVGAQIGQSYNSVAVRSQLSF